MINSVNLGLKRELKARSKGPLTAVGDEQCKMFLLWTNQSVIAKGTNLSLIAKAVNSISHSVKILQFS